MSDTSARASRRALRFGSLARNGLIGVRTGVPVALLTESATGRASLDAAAGVGAGLGRIAPGTTVESRRAAVACTAGAIAGGAAAARRAGEKGGTRGGVGRGATLLVSSCAGS